MDRPLDPQLDAVMLAAEELRGVEARAAQDIADAKLRLAAKVDALAEIDDPSALLKAAVYAYWYAPEVSPNQLALLTVGKPSSTMMLKRSGAVSIGVPCRCCGKDLAITSRSMMREVLVAASNEAKAVYRFQTVCLDCRKRQEEERLDAYRLAEIDREERRYVLSRLSYSEYLATPEWRSHRDAMIGMMLECHGELTCEVCPEREDLSFVHSQFDMAKGQNVAALLCAACRGALFGAGKLAHPPLPANRAPRIELDLAERAFRAERYGDADERD